MECLCAAVSGRPMVKFESGFTVETVFDGSKLGIEPHTVEVLPNGELLILDSANSNIYRISSSLSLCKWVLCGLKINCWFRLNLHLYSVTNYSFDLVLCSSIIPLLIV